MMPRRIEHSVPFDRESERLSRKYRSLPRELTRLRQQFLAGELPGIRLSGVGSHVYKVRLPNRSARRGKSGGFRVIYQERDGILVLLLLIYSKSERADIPDDAIRRVIAEFD